MRAGAGKQKGGSFEREICRKLSLWISAGERDDLFWRSSLSGGRATVAFKKGKQNLTQCGDISSIHPDGNVLTDPYLISCKFYSDLKLEGAMLGNKGGISQFWEECVEEAKRYNKKPILIAKQNNTQPFVGLNAQGVIDFEVGKYIMVWLPVAGGMKILWLETFLKTAKVPSDSGIRRPTILRRPGQ